MLTKHPSSCVCIAFSGRPAHPVGRGVKSHEAGASGEFLYDAAALASMALCLVVLYRSSGA